MLDRSSIQVAQALGRYPANSTAYAHSDGDVELIDDIGGDATVWRLADDAGDPNVVAGTRHTAHEMIDSCCTAAIPGSVGA
jgi:hypothetical protein